MAYDYALRMERLRKKISEASMDAFLVTAQDSIYYLTGASYKPLERPFFIIVRPEGESDLVVPELEREHMSKAKGFKTVLSYFDYPAPEGENWFDKLSALLNGCKRVGVETSVSAEIMKELTDFTLTPRGLVNELRLIKAEDEIQVIRRAAAYADQGMGSLVKNLYSGVSVLELFSLSRGIQTEIIKSGDYDPLNSKFLTVGWPAPKSAQPHSVPGLSDRLGKGPLSLMSFLRINGYAAECERTVFMGKPSDEEKELFEHMRRAREEAFAMVKPGTPCSEIDAATKDYYQKNGLSRYILHRTGHGIGMGNHEAPWLSEGSEDVLQKNMVVSIEPAVYLPEIGGFRHSDTVLVTDTGHECLTKFPTSLGDLTLPESNPLKSAKGGIIRRAVGMKD
jgi:Xaa-Pro aminopeptidase